MTRAMPDPASVASTDGIKIESLATSEHSDGSAILFLGTDDDGYGGLVRQLPTQ